MPPKSISRPAALTLSEISTADTPNLDTPVRELFCLSAGGLKTPVVAQALLNEKLPAADEKVNFRSFMDQPPSGIVTDLAPLPDLQAGSGTISPPVPSSTYSDSSRDTSPCSVLNFDLDHDTVTPALLLSVSDYPDMHIPPMGHHVPHFHSELEYHYHMANLGPMDSAHDTMMASFPLEAPEIMNHTVMTYNPVPSRAATARAAPAPAPAGSAPTGSDAAKAGPEVGTGAGVEAKTEAKTEAETDAETETETETETESEDDKPAEVPVMNNKLMFSAQMQEELDRYTNLSSVGTPEERYLARQEALAIATIKHHNELLNHSCINQICADPLIFKISQKPNKGHAKCRLSGCALRGDTFMEIAQHIDEEHLDTWDSYNFVCQSPNCVWSIFGFNTRGELNRHMRSNHNCNKDIVVHTCRACHRDFQRSDSLKRHYKTCFAWAQALVSIREIAKQKAAHKTTRKDLPAHITKRVGRPANSRKKSRRRDRASRRAKAGEV